MLDDDTEHKYIPSSFVGFQSDHGQKVGISDESLKTARKMLKGDTEQKEIKFCWVPGHGKKVQISDKSLKAAKMMFEESVPNER